MQVVREINTSVDHYRDPPTSSLSFLLDPPLSPNLLSTIQALSITMFVSHLHHHPLDMCAKFNIATYNSI